MPKTILKTFRLPLEVAREIEAGAEQNNISQTQYVVSVLVENRFLKLRKSFEDDVKNMAADQAYKSEQQKSAEENYL